MVLVRIRRREGENIEDFHWISKMKVDCRFLYCRSRLSHYYMVGQLFHDIVQSGCTRRSAGVNIKIYLDLYVPRPPSWVFDQSECRI